MSSLIWMIIFKSKTREPGEVHPGLADPDGWSALVGGALPWVWSVEGKFGTERQPRSVDMTDRISPLTGPFNNVVR